MKIYFANFPHDRYSIPMNEQEVENRLLSFHHITTTKIEEDQFKNYMKEGLLKKKRRKDAKDKY